VEKSKLGSFVFAIIFIAAVLALLGGESMR
jgi:hypothetical protein